MNTVISIESVVQRLGEMGTVIVDCRFMMGQLEYGQSEYAEGHLPGAFYMNLEKDLSGPIEEHGGRHSLPDVMQLADKFSRIGIDESKMVIVYDDQDGAMASRLWWLLKYYGHKQVYVMEQGYSTWVSQGYPVTTEVPVVKPAHFVATLQHNMLVDVYKVQEKLDSGDAVLIDSREAPRYKGEIEPIDPVAGHIPGALNHFWKESLNAEGRWKSPDEQADRFVTAVRGKDDEIIVYCGSGVTACPNIMALHDAGYTNVKLYAGSWSDWISYQGNPVAVGDEEERKDI